LLSVFNVFWSAYIDFNPDKETEHEIHKPSHDAYVQNSKLISIFQLPESVVEEYTSVV